MHWGTLYIREARKSERPVLICSICYPMNQRHILRPDPTSADVGSLSVIDVKSRVFELQEPLQW